MSDNEDKGFNGTGLLVWLSDGKQKYKVVSEQDAMEKEVNELEKRVPPRAIAEFIIDWDNQTVMARVGEAKVETKN